MNVVSVSKEQLMAAINEKVYQAGEVFRPSAPINSRDLFSGRIEQVRTVLNAIAQSGQHAIIYGERGVGKTSLASVIRAFLPSGREYGIVTVKVNCDVSMSFKSLFEAILSEITLEFKKPGMGFSETIVTEVKTLADYVDRSKKINPNELRFLFRGLESKIIIIIDEFDRIRNLEARKLLADTIKNFSDYSVDTTFILVGVADSVSDLITEHQSIERALVQIQMPRMSEAELAEIIDKGLLNLKLTIEAKAKSKIIRLSQGLPHYTHLISLYASQAAIMRQSEVITEEHVELAITEAITKSQETVQSDYHRAVSSAKANLYTQVLLACAMVRKNERGFFMAADVREPLKKVMGKDYEINAFSKHLKAFCEDDRGPILQKTDAPTRSWYRFTNPLMEPFIIMRGLDKGLIKDEDLS